MRTIFLSLTCLFLLVLLSTAPVAAQTDHIYQDFDNPVLIPPWLYGATGQIIAGVLGTPSASGVALLATGDNNTIGPSQGIAVYHEFVLPNSVYITSVTAWVYNDANNMSSFQLIEWDADTGAHIFTWSVGGSGTGNRTLTLNRVVSRKFWVALHKSGFGGTSTIGIDNLRINVDQLLSPTALPTFTPTSVPPTPVPPTSTPFVVGWLPTRASVLLPVCASTPTLGVSPTRAFGGTVYARTPVSGGDFASQVNTEYTAVFTPTSTLTRTPIPCIPRHEVVDLASFPPLVDIGVGGVTSETCITIVPLINIPSSVVLSGLPLFGDVTITIPLFGGLQVSEHQLCIRLRDFKFAFLGADVSWVISTALAMLGLWFLLFFRREM